MKKAIVLTILILSVGLFSWKQRTKDLRAYYLNCVENLKNDIAELKKLAQNGDSAAIENQLKRCRIQLKQVDPFLRYMAPMQHKHINGPLPVEWETEVFEKFEKPYKRTGGGLYLFEQALSENDRDQAIQFLEMASAACDGAKHDTLLIYADKAWNSFYTNRLFLLNLGAVYTTGFENPNPSNVIAELIVLMEAQQSIYELHNYQFPDHPFSKEYLTSYALALNFVQNQPKDIGEFDHFAFMRNYVNPLFKLNSRLIKQYKLHSRNLLDFSLNPETEDIFDKSLYEGMDTKGYFRHIDDRHQLEQIAALGEMWFFDPIFSGNLKRSCASCHKTGQYFTDTTVTTAVAFDFRGNNSRNAPTLLNVGLNHLATLDGRFYTLFHQMSDVIQNPFELNQKSHEIMRQMDHIPAYKEGLKFLSRLTPDHPKPEFGHVMSAVITYYSSFNEFYSPFDSMMRGWIQYDEEIAKGYNLFMGKAACGTCHFAPHFGGVKPPYTGSEFEVLGTPADHNYSSLSADSGRYSFNPAHETLRAFRTPILKNISRTAPYMHNGSLRTLNEVLEFYNAGGGIGKGFILDNQTLSADSLHLTPNEMDKLIIFMQALDEKPNIKVGPKSLPPSKNKKLNQRKPGGEY